MEKTLIFRSDVEKALAIANLSKKTHRTALVVAMVAISSAVMFASLVLSASLKSGIAGLRSRIGADLLVVPEGYEKGEERILLSGEPNYFYMERNVVDSVRSVSGVSQASAQFYLTSVSESCCDFPVQIIGFEPDSDFVVKSWAKTGVSGISGGEFLLSGFNVSDENGTVRFFGGEHKIAGRLSKSGSGMDNVIFCDMESLRRIFDDASRKGFGFVSDGDTENKISSVLVRLSDDASADAVALRIKKAVPGVQVIIGEKFIRNFSGKISAVLVFLYSISALVLLVAFFSLALIFSVTINERRREFSILRVLGATKRQLRSVLFHEAAILGGAGSVLGIIIAALVVIPFSGVISQKIALPFSPGGFGTVLCFAAAVFVAVTLSCVASAAKSAVRISKAEPYGDVK